MTNVTFEEWVALIANLAIDLGARFPRLKTSSHNDLTLQVGSVSANIDLRGGRRAGSMEPHASFGSGPAIVGSPSTVEMILQDTRLILDALHIAIAATEKHAVWGELCPCDRCRATGKDLRGGTCEVCDGKGTR